MLFGEDFEVIKELEAIFKKIGKYEEFYAYEKDGKLEYEILDTVFCQPSPANWHEGEYAQHMREKSSKILQDLLDDGYIKII